MLLTQKTKFHRRDAEASKDFFVGSYVFLGVSAVKSENGIGRGVHHSRSNLSRRE
jgi:hypothetical protein